METAAHGDHSVWVWVCVCLSLQKGPMLKSRTSAGELSGVPLKALKVAPKKKLTKSDEQEVKDVIMSAFSKGQWRRAGRCFFLQKH